MSALDILNDLANEAAKASGPKVEADFEFTLDNFFELDAELEQHFDSIALINNQMAILENIQDKFETEVSQLTPAAVGVVNAIVSTSLVAFTGVDAFESVTLSAEEAKGEDEKEGDTKTKANKSGKSMKERAGDLKNKVVLIFKKIGAKIGDVIRKFRTGQSRLISNLEAVKAKAEDSKDYKITSVSKAFYIGKDLVSPKSIGELTKVVQTQFAKETADNSYEVEVTGGQKFQVNVESGGKVTNKFVDAEANPMKELSLKGDAVKDLCDELIKMLKSFSAIDHGKITKEFLKTTETLMANGASMDVANSRVQYLRALTVTVPVKVAKDVVSIKAALSAVVSGKADKSKDEKPKDDKSKDEAPKGEGEE